MGICPYKGLKWLKLGYDITAGRILTYHGHVQHVRDTMQHVRSLSRLLNIKIRAQNMRVGSIVATLVPRSQIWMV